MYNTIKTQQKRLATPLKRCKFFGGGGKSTIETKINTRMYFSPFVFNLPIALQRKVSAKLLLIAKFHYTDPTT